jgi:hypothetical protein
MTENIQGVYSEKIKSDLIFAPPCVICPPPRAGVPAMSGFTKFPKWGRSHRRACRLRKFIKEYQHNNAFHVPDEVQENIASIQARAVEGTLTGGDYATISALEAQCLHFTGTGGGGKAAFATGPLKTGGPLPPGDAEKFVDWCIKAESGVVTVQCGGGVQLTYTSGALSANGALDPDDVATLVVAIAARAPGTGETLFEGLCLLLKRMWAQAV